MMNNWKTNNKIACSTMVLVMLVAGLSGCIGSDDSEETLRIAFSVKDDYASFDENPQKLADYLSDATGLNIELYPITSDSLALEALRFGSADMAFLDGGAAWMGWQSYGLEAMAADMKSDGRTYYSAHAWVLNDSAAGQAALDDDDTTDPFAELAGEVSCHTGWLKSAGMLIPMGYLIGNGYAEVIGDPTEIDSLEATVHGFFSEDSSIPRGSSPYSSYKGAMRCMMEGAGDIALIKDTVYDSYCTGSDAHDWCLERDEVVMLKPFGQAPSHPALYNPENMDLETVSLVQEALGALNEDQEGADILWDLLYTKDMIPTNAQDHLGTYGAAVSNVPGIQAYFG